MSSIPSSPRSAVYEWCNARVDPWRTNAANIGLQPDDALTFATSVSAYSVALGEQSKAKAALQAATLTVNEAYTAMRRNMSDGVTDIRQFAQRQTDPNAVYELAQVPPRSSGGTLPPPGRPFDFSVQLIDDSGAVQLRWKCENPRGTQGTSYIVRRRLPGETAFGFIGVTGEKRFVDSTFTAGPDSVEYTVQAQRADSAGPVSAIYVINFGVPGPGRNRQVANTTQAA